MSYYDNEFYNYPNEYEMLIGEFKESIAKSVKKEFIDKLNKLEAENEELQYVKDNLQKIKQEYNDKVLELEIKIINADKEAKEKRLSELLRDREVLLYRPYQNRFKKPKCNNCDENRKISYTTPLGKKAYEDCDCSIDILRWMPKEYKCIEFSLIKNSNIMEMKYDINESLPNHEWYTFSQVETMYKKDINYEKINKFRIGFKDKEDCQKYCDWLNKNEK